MSDPESRDIHEVLSEKYRHYRPIKSAPSLFTLNGCGLAMYGNRDYDEETGTYVKTHALCLIFVPILALGAYRVADAPEGWYFLGKERLSGFAYTWNRALVTILILAVGAGFYNSYSNSPPVLSEKALAKADEAVESGDYLEAVHGYQAIIRKSWPDQDEAREKRGSTLKQALVSEDPGEVTGALAFLKKHDAALVENAVELGLGAVDHFEEDNPVAAIEILESLSPLAPLDLDLSQRRMNLLLRLHELKPQDKEIAGKLAALHGAAGEYDKVITLLEPFRDSLKNEERVGLLGQAYAAQGQHGDAVALLQPMVSSRIELLSNAEMQLSQTVEKVWRKEIKKLENGKGPSFFYSKYDSLSEDEQGYYVESYVGKQIERNPSYIQAQEQYETVSKIIPIAFDLGLSQIQLAQEQSDPAARRKQLEDAEKTFLSLQSSAGESLEYRLLMGQVKYWLGDQDEGFALFEEALKSEGRSCQILLLVGEKLRELGVRSQAYTLFEEAYNKATTEAEKSQAANSCYLTTADEDLQLQWLEKAGEDNPIAAANMASHKGYQAVEDGQTADAARHFRKALEIYNGMAESETTLNNRSLIYQDLFSVTGNADHYRSAAKDMVAALKIAPDDPIIVVNTLHTLVQSAYLQILSPHFDFATLEGNFSSEMLQMLYKDDAGRQEVIKLLRNLPEIEQAMRLKNRAITLAPNNSGTYSTVSWLLNAVRDHEGLYDLSRRCLAANVDNQTVIEKTRESFTETDLSEPLESTLKFQERYRKIRDNCEPGSLSQIYCSLALIRGRLALHSLGQPQDLQALLAEAEELQALQDCSLTREVLSQIHYVLLDDELAQDNAGYAALKDKMNRFWSCENRIGWALLDPNLCDSVKGHPLFESVIMDFRNSQEAFPGVEVARDWLLASQFDPALAQTIREKALANRISESTNCLNRTLNPVAPSVIFSDYILALMQGDKERAELTLAKARENNIPMPEA